MEGPGYEALARQLQAIDKKLEGLAKNAIKVKDLSKNLNKIEATLHKIETKVDKLFHEISYL